MAVSKKHPPSAIRVLYDLGQRDFGENYFDEWLAKQVALADLPDLRWHFIGPLQSNKFRRLVPHVAMIHTLSQKSHIKKLARFAADEQRLQVMIQVNAAHEPQKAGCHPDELPELIQGLKDCPNLHYQGIMALPPRIYQDPAEDAFVTVPALYQQLAQWRDQWGGELSLGMSGDLRIAIHAGTDWVRIGTDIFGPRPEGP